MASMRCAHGASSSPSTGARVVQLSAGEVIITVVATPQPPAPGRYSAGWQYDHHALCHGASSGPSTGAGVVQLGAGEGIFVNAISTCHQHLAVTQQGGSITIIRALSMEPVAVQVPVLGLYNSALAK